MTDWLVGRATCKACGMVWYAVYPAGTPTDTLACPGCAAEDSTARTLRRLPDARAARAHKAGLRPR